MSWDFSGGPVVKNLPSNAGDMGSIPGRGTKSPRATTREKPMCRNEEPACRNEISHMPQLRPDVAKNNKK